MPDRAELLIAVSSDFGELANALYLLEGSPRRAHLLLPPRLYEKNLRSLPHSASQYRTLEDILAALHFHQPRALLLFSGYIFGINQLLNPAELSCLLHEARQTNTTLATTDPFLGILSTLNENTFVHPQKAALAAHFAAVEKMLHTVPHLYLSPLPNQPGRLCFYNPRLMLSAADRAAPAQPPRWLFVLSLEDYVSQCSHHGRAAFDDQLLHLMNHALAAGRRPVFLAPQTARDALSPRLPPDATLLEFSSHDQFRALLLNAEHVFYWNIFSNSILARVANHGSVFFFDSGHLARSIPSAVPIAMQSYFANAALPMLDAAHPPTAAALAYAAQSQPALFAPALTAFRALPSPETTLTALLAERPQ